MVSSADPVLNLNNMQNIPFEDFLILHKIFPKIFMLDIDFRQGLNKKDSKGALNDNARTQSETSEFRAMMRDKIKNKDAINMERAIQRRSKVQAQHSRDRANQVSTLKGQNIKVVNALEVQ